MYKKIDLSKPWDDPANREARLTPLPVYACLSSNHLPSHFTTYMAIVSKDGPFQGQASVSLNNLETNEHNLLLIEAAQEKAIAWMSPHDVSVAYVEGITSESDFSHRAGTHGLRVDFSAWFLSADSQNRAEWLRYKPK